ncbi:MAG TPA: hypothetical protein VFF65_03340 [Phycisphaerales bacterium]|nr:hypothetical protein [Phycisphaerales bacterium]
MLTPDVVHNQLLSTKFGTLIAVLRKDSGGKSTGLNLIGGDRSALGAMGFISFEKQCKDFERPNMPGERVEGAPTPLWTWSMLNWYLHVTDPEQLVGAKLWSSPSWNGGAIRSFHWPHFTHGGTIVRALFNGVTAESEEARLYTAGKRGPEGEYYDSGRAFYEFRRRYDPLPNPDPRGNDQCNIPIQVSEITKKLVPLPESVYAMIKGG